MSENFVTTLNTEIRNDEKEIVLANGEYNSARACLAISNKSGIVLDFSQASVKAENSLIDIKNSQDITIKNLNLDCFVKNDFAIKVKNSKNIKFENLKIKAENACVWVGQTSIFFSSCEFESDKGNGVCITFDSDVVIKTSNFEIAKGECVSVIDNNYGTVQLQENAFKHSGVGIKSAGRNSINITNNYFMTALYSVGCFKSLFSEENLGASKIQIAYNIFDEFGDGAVVVVEGNGTDYLHDEISINDNIFSSRTRPVMIADGVKTLSFKENSVKTNGESSVENSIINGIKA